MPIRPKDYYWILDVPVGAAPTQIRRAYLKLARKYHPDLNPENRLAEEKFKEIQEAYQVLSDPERRREFDNQNRPPPPPSYRRPRPASHSSNRPTNPPKQGLGEFIQTIFGIRAVRTASGSRSRGQKPPGGPQTQLVLSLEDAHKGGIHRITVLDRRRCPICRGRKKLDNRPCPQCRASGQLHTPVNIDVNIPPGARNGCLIKVAGRHGTRGRSGGGEIYVKVVVEPHPVFRIDGDDIYFDVPITPWEAALGASIDIQGIDGRSEIRVPAGAEGGKRVRLRGAGLNRHDGGRGDAYVRLNIVVPDHAGEREKALYQELARITGFNPRSPGNSGGAK
jgi:DnaJ-class molecular chaperone